MTLRRPRKPDIRVAERVERLRTAAGEWIVSSLPAELLALALSRGMVSFLDAYRDGLIINAFDIALPGGLVVARIPGRNFRYIDEVLRKLREKK